MASYLLIDKQKKKEDPDYVSKFQPLLDMMPSDTNNFPVNFTKDELEILKGSAVNYLIAKITKRF